MTTATIDLGSLKPDEIPPLHLAIAFDAKLSFEFFVKEFFECIPGVGPLVWNWHLSLFCRELEELARRVHKGEQKTHDLVVNVPFGTTKSSIISILFQCWVWSWWPAARFLCGTHTDSLALNLAQRTKDVITSEKYQQCFPDVQIRRDVSAKEDFANTEGGERKSCTVGGKTPTGRHSHFVIIDDPIDPQGVYSQAVVETAAKFITEVVPSRVVDKGVVPIVLVMQRLHPRDPTAVMLAVGRVDGGTPVRHICLPGELGSGALPPSPSLAELRSRWPEAYVEDNLLDPKRLSRRVLNDLRSKLSRFAYGGQVLQNPILPGGGMFEEGFFQQRVKAAPFEAQRVRFWDRAATVEGGCYTAGVLMCCDREGYYYVEDVVHGQWGPRERNLRIVATARRDRARYGPKHEPTIVIEGERGSTGEESYAHLARMLAGFRVKEDLPSGSKDVRAEPWSCLVGETLINTDRGPRRIDAINVGDLVLTRRGFRRVSDSRETKKTLELVTIFLYNGDTLRGTPDHKVWVVGKGWTPMMDINTRDEVVTCRSQEKRWSLVKQWSRLPHKSSPEKLSSLMGSCFTDPPKVCISALDIQLLAKPLGFTELSGRTTTEQFRRGTKYITKMGMLTIMPSVTLNVYQPATTERSTEVKTWRRLCNGMLQRRRLNIERKMDGQPQSEPFLGNTPACDVVSNLHLKPVTKRLTIVPGFAAPDLSKTANRRFVSHAVKRYGVGVKEALDFAPMSAENDVYPPNASPAAENSFVSMRVTSIVHEIVPEPVPVYDLTVDDEHEFFANGVLVHNCQLAAGNVYIVDNGESMGTGRALWDVQGYVEEHVLFRPEAGKRVGGICDRVDASSGAFNILSGRKQVVGAFRVLPSRPRGNKSLRLVVCSADELPSTIIEERTLLVCLTDPEPEGGVTDSPAVIDGHSLARLLDTLTLRFADIAPAEYQDRWENPVDPWGIPPERLIMTPAEGKKLWAFITRHRDPQPEVIVIVDERREVISHAVEHGTRTSELLPMSDVQVAPAGETAPLTGRRALSAAYAVADVLRLPRQSTVHVLADPDGKRDGKPPNEHVYNITKVSRNYVV